MIHKVKKSKWKSFIIDLGDTVGGIGIGVVTQNWNLVLCLFSVTILLLSFYFKVPEENTTELGEEQNNINIFVTFQNNNKNG